MSISPLSPPKEQTPATASVRDGGGEAPARDIALHVADEHREAFRWDLALVWFMRVLALAWMAKGLAYWAILLGVLPEVAPFDGQTMQWQTIVVYFAVIDLVAAVGLWLTSTWGGVMWLLAAMSYLLAAVMAPHAVVSGPLLLGGLGLLVVTYFLLSWYASRIEA